VAVANALQLEAALRHAIPFLLMRFFSEHEYDRRMSSYRRPLSAAGDFVMTCKHNELRPTRRDL